MTRDHVDPAQCPLCAQPNGCGMVAGAATCWCFDVNIGADLLARVPAAAQRVACICASCAKSSAPLPLIARGTNKNRL